MTRTLAVAMLILASAQTIHLEWDEGQLVMGQNPDRTNERIAQEVEVRCGRADRDSWPIRTTITCPLVDLNRDGEVSLEGEAFWCPGGTAHLAGTGPNLSRPGYTFRTGLAQPHTSLPIHRVIHEPRPGLNYKCEARLLRVDGPSPWSNRIEFVFPAYLECRTDWRRAGWARACQPRQ